MSTRLDRNPTAAARPAAAARAIVVYTIGRVAVFVAIAAVLFGIGVGLVVLSGHGLDAHTLRPVALAAAFIAVPVSMLASYFLLARQRSVLTGLVEQTVAAYRARSAARTAAEDVYADQLLAQQAARAQAAGRDTVARDTAEPIDGPERP